MYRMRCYRKWEKGFRNNVSSLGLDALILLLENLEGEVRSSKMDIGSTCCPSKWGSWPTSRNVGFTLP